MAQITSIIEMINNQRLKSKLVACCFIFLFITSFFSWQQASAKNVRLSLSDFNHAVFSSSVKNNPCNQHNSPLEFESIPQLCESSDENESDGGDDTDQQPANYDSEVIFIENFRLDNSFEPAIFIEPNRSSIALFVLHHSWKTFLS